MAKHLLGTSPFSRSDKTLQSIPQGVAIAGHSTAPLGPARKAHADMGILGFADADALGQHDEKVAVGFDRRRQEVECLRLWEHEG